MLHVPCLLCNYGVDGAGLDGLPVFCLHFFGNSIYDISPFLKTNLTYYRRRLRVE